MSVKFDLQNQFYIWYITIQEKYLFRKATVYDKGFSFYTWLYSTVLKYGKLYLRTVGSNPRDIINGYLLINMIKEEIDLLIFHNFIPCKFPGV